MSSPLRQLLAQFREASRTEREKGNYFERLAVAFINNDSGMQQEYEGAWLLSDWAKLQGVSAADIGVDVVAKIRGEDGFCAVQCKFYSEGRSIPKSELREDRQGKWHPERCESLRRRNRGRSCVSAAAFPTHHYRQLGNDENCSIFAKA